MPADFVNQDALIRYTVTPVTEPDSGQVIGALVSGDIVNGKTAIPRDTLDALGNGYSAVYQPQADGSFALTTSLNIGNNADAKSARVDVSLADSTLMKQAVINPSQIITRQGDVGGVTQTLAAKAILDFHGEPIAVLVRGTSALSQTPLIADSFKLYVLLAGPILTVYILLARLIGRSILRPLKVLQQATRKFGVGNHSVRAQIFATDEVGQVAKAFNHLANELTESESRLQAQVQHNRRAIAQASLLTSLTHQMRQALDEQTVLDTAVEGLRQILKVDRVLIYRFHPDYKAGDITAESVARHWDSFLGRTLKVPLTPRAIERFRLGRTAYREDQGNPGNRQCHWEIAEQLDIKAYAIAPLLVGKELLGLMCAQQCSQARKWEPTDLDLMQQVAIQIGCALGQSSLLKQQATTARAQQLTEVIAQIQQNWDESHIYQAAVTGVRGALDTDRVIVYRFDANYKVTPVAESLGEGWSSVLDNNVDSLPGTTNLTEAGQTLQAQAIPNILAAASLQTYRTQLEHYQIKAQLVAPIMVGESQLGLLVAHQCSAPRNWASVDVRFLTQVAMQLGRSIEQARQFQQKQLTTIKGQQLNELVFQMQTAQEEEQLYSIAVDRIHQVLATDRTSLYWFDTPPTGRFVVEAVDRAWPSVSIAAVPTSCWVGSYLEQGEQDDVQVIDDIHTAGLTKEHQAQLRSLQVKASLIAPVIVEETLVGLLITHQCSQTRTWEHLEIDFLKQAAMQLGRNCERIRLNAQAQALAEDYRHRQEVLHKQLTQLASDMEAAVQGDLMVRTQVPSSEVGIVANRFNQLLDDVNQLVIQVKEVGQHVNMSIVENDEAVQTLTRNSLIQAEEVTHTLASLSDISQSIERVANQVEQVSVIASKASSKAENSGEAMDLTVNSILSLRDTISETSKKVKRLGESSQQISKVVGLIHDIAKQTNLLAINAGIEANRAGAAGKGFTVIAEAVGELASRSAKATREIEQLVRTIQEETTEVVEAMDRSTSEVVVGTRFVQDAKYDISRILEVSQRIDHLLNSVSKTTVSHVEVSQTVTQLMQDIIQLSEHTSESSGQISDSLHQTLGAIQTLQTKTATFRTTDA